MATFNPNAGVPPLVTLTKPYGITKLTTPIYYCSTITNCTMHRPDGKKLPFVSSFLKVTLEEDRDYLDNEIEVGNIYIRRANVQEQEQARMMEDPLGVIKDHLRADVKKEITDGFSVEDLETLLEKKRLQKEANAQFPVGVIPQTSGAEEVLGTRAIPADETAEQRLVRLAQEARALALSGRFSPASTASLSTGADSNSSRV